MIEALLRRDRLVVTGMLLGTTMLAWAYLLHGAGMGMSAVDMTRMVYGDHSVMQPGMMMASDWSLGYAAVMFTMWWVMMVAMMLPSAAPVILLAANVNRKASPDARPYGSTGAFMGGYLLAWGVFSLIATLLQWALQASGLLSSMTLDSRSPVLAASLLLAAALWQLTPVKQACLRHCRSPVALLVSRHGRPAFATGLAHGAYCVGCCWFLMLLLFVGGVMNLFWIVALALLVLVEKLLPRGRTAGLVLAAVLASSGIYVLIG